MHRSFVFTCLMIAPLMTVYSGCSGSPEVAQAPAGAGVGAFPAPSSNAVSPSSTEPESTSEDESGADSASMGGVPSMGGPPGMNGTPGMGGPPGMGGSGMNGYANSSSDSSTMQGMGGMGMTSPNTTGAMSGGAPDMGYGPPGMEGMAGMGGMPGMGMGMGGMPGMGPSGQFAAPADPAPPEDADYLTKSRYAFSIGKEKEAIEYAQAYAVVTAEGVDVLQKTKWFAPGLRPATAIRFAVGVVLEAPATLTDFKPIGSKQLQSGGGGGSGGMMGKGAPGGTANSKAKEHPLYDLTGSFGEAVISGFQERWAAGKFGSIFSDVEKVESKATVGNAGMGKGMMGMGMMGGGMPGGMEGMGVEGSGGPSGMSSDGTTAARPRIMPGSVVVPGMVYLGSSEKPNDLMKKAEERGVDIVFLFDVTVSPPNRLNGIVQNETRVRVVSIKGDNLVRSSELLNTKVERAQMSASGEDEVAKATEKFFAQFDEKVKLTDMPVLKPEHARARLVSVLSNAKVSKLEKLFEVSLYRSMQAISDDDKTTACLIAMEGSEGETLAGGRPEDKQMLLDAMLPSYK